MKNPFIGGEFQITSPYGMRELFGVTSFHYGVDLVGISSKNICAVTSGKVIVSQIITDKNNPTWEWGNYVGILGEDGCVIYYCHMSKRLVTVGDVVNQGDIIGIEGDTGYSFGSHLHFEVRDNNNITIDPTSYLGINNSVGSYNIEEDDDMDVNRFKELWLEMRAELQDNDASSWSEEARKWAVETGLVQGSTANGEPNNMWEDVLTREQLVTILYRYSQLNK